MFKSNKVFTNFSVDDAEKAREFYAQTLGLDVAEEECGLALKFPGNNPIFIYQKDDHQPATFTILNLPVDDIDKAVDELTKKGVKFEHYDNGLKTDAK